MYGVDSKDSVPADFPKKNSGLAPEGLSILAGTGAGHRPLWRPTMALKIKIPGEPVGHPGASFPVPTRLASGKCGSICEGRGRPRMILTAFDPAFLSSRKGVAIRPDLKKTGMAGCPRIKNAVLLKRTSNARPHPFVRVSARRDKRMQKRRRGSPGPQMVSRFSFRKTGVAFFS